MSTSSENKDLLCKFVYGKIYSLTNDLDSGLSKAQLASLRRGVGKRPGEMPELWGMFLQNMPEELMSKYGEPTCEEWAIYTTLTLFALHQQGHSEPMYESNENSHLGCAVRKLVHNDDEEERISFKLGLVADSEDMAELSYRLKTIVRLLSNEAIKLDYVDLAQDLYFFQKERSTNNVRLKWGQDFYRIKEDRKED